MINPAEVTNYNRTQYELEEFILFCINVAGKKSAIEAPKLEVFIERAKDITKETTPFNCIRKLIKLGRLNEIMHWAKLSPYAQRYNSYVAVAKIKDLQTVTLNRLLQVPGIGLKTARFFCHIPVKTLTNLCWTHTSYGSFAIKDTVTPQKARQLMRALTIISRTSLRASLAS